VTARSSASVALAIGLGAVLAAAIAGAAGEALSALATPPALIRAALVGGAVVLGGYLLVLALRRIDEARGAAPASALSSSSMSTAQLGTMVRGIRFVFLAAAAFSAGIGWLVGHPLPIVVGLVIAGVDLAETSFLLLVATSRGS
jgi:hypothetical protein